VTKGKGYLLPSGDASEEELACCIVFYPARDEYRRALMGSLDYLATWIAWERDSEKRGQDAAASWKLANIQTWECCSMGFCDDLATSLTDILAAITALECCGEQDISDGDWYTDPVIDGEGDVPQNIIDAGYAEDAEDWDGFDSYKCMISHLAVDHVEAFFRQIAPYIAESGTVFGGVGVLSALLGSMLILFGLPLAAGLILSLGVAASVWNWISKYGKGAVEDIADEIATHHDALACAIYQGDGVADSVSDFNDKVDELFSSIDAAGIKAINIAPQLKAMYAGRYDQQDIAAKLEEQGFETSGYNCDTCGQELGDFVFNKTEFPDNIDHTRINPACSEAQRKTFIGYVKDDESQWSENWRVKGTIFLTGFMLENDNCANHQDIFVHLKICADGSTAGWPTCTTSSFEIYIEHNYPSGDVDLELPFDEISDLNLLLDYRELVIETQVDFRYGDVDVDISIFIELIEELP
jgi:hypothetical protein